MNLNDKSLYKVLIVRILFCFASLCFYISISAQNNVKSELIEFKTGTIMVQLQTQSAKLHALNITGRTNEADEINKSNDLINQNIITTFSHFFNFNSNVFFYSSDHAKDVQAGRYEGFVYDAMGKPMETDINRPVYFILIGHVYLKTFNSHMKGLAILDSNFNVLPKPFPSIIRKREAIPFLRRTEPEMIVLLNQRIIKMYEEKTGEK